MQAGLSATADYKLLCIGGWIDPGTFQEQTLVAKGSSYMHTALTVLGVLPLGQSMLEKGGTQSHSQGE